jgi:hypothetical protein
MHKELKQFFDTHRAGTAAKKREMHDQLAPVVSAIADVLQHAIALQTQLHQAELASHDHVLDPKMAWMHKRLRVVLDRGNAARTAISELAKALVDLEKGFNQDQIESLRAMSSRRPGEPIPDSTDIASGTAQSPSIDT